MANKHPPFVQKMIYVTLLYSCQIGVVKIERLSPKRVSAEACKAQQLATEHLAPRANTWMAPVGCADERVPFHVPSDPDGL